MKRACSLNKSTDEDISYEFFTELRTGYPAFKKSNYSRMKTLSLLIFALFCTINTMAQPWIITAPGNIYYNQGNVGIGITSVGIQTILHVKESGTSTDIWRGRIVASGDKNAVVMGERNGKAWFGAHNAELNSWSDLIMQTHGGNIGIGTENPVYKVDVNGTIRAKEVKVETGWADYVFDKEYNLQDLSEVELFINEHKHLPDIPDAKEVEKNGVNLGEMNALLLKKIEELTLYAITQNKKVEELSLYSIEQNKSIKEQAKKIEALEKTVNNLISK